MAETNGSVTNLSEAFRAVIVEAIEEGVQPIRKDVQDLRGDVEGIKDDVEASVDLMKELEKNLNNRMDVLQGSMENNFRGLDNRISKLEFKDR